MKSEDALYTIEECQLLEHLKVFQVSRSNKSIQVRFDSDRAVQQFVDCKISLNGNNLAFWSNVQRRLRVSIHGVYQWQHEWWFSGAIPRRPVVFLDLGPP